MAKKNPTAEFVATLAQVRTRFGPAAAKEKRGLLTTLCTMPLTRSTVIRRYHDILLFLLAFPDDAGLRKQADLELQRVADVVHEAAGRDDKPLWEQLSDSGIAGSVNECAYTFGITRWLMRRFPGDVELLLEVEADSAPLDDFREKLVAHVERDGVRRDGLSFEGWFHLAKGRHRESVLEWLVSHLEKLPLSGEMLDHVFDSLHVNVVWHLDHPDASTTWQRFPPRRIAYRKNSAFRHVPMGKALAIPLPQAQYLSPGAARRLIDVARASLSVRRRETEATNFATDKDVTLFSLEKGIDIALFGLTPDRRLPIESYFSFIAAKNRLPVAYGGGFVFLEQLDIGYHVFDMFRGGESMFIFTQMLRTFCQHFHIGRVVVDAAQFGAGRPDGVRSGAFWLYYKLGFRPVDATIATLAEQEAKKVGKDRAYRSPVSALRRLTGSNLAFDLVDDPRQIPDLADIAIAVSDRIAEGFHGDRHAAAQWARRRVSRLLGVRGIRSWPRAERESYQRLSLLVALFPQLGSWTTAEKRALVALMRAKGAARERDYVMKLQRHEKARRALLSIAETGKTAVA